MNLHFAGTETAIHWNGYMDGAVSAGERAATEVLWRLQDVKQWEEKVQHAKWDLLYPIKEGLD